MSHLNIKTMLNVKEKFKGFVFKSSKLILNNGERRIEVAVRPRKGSQGRCSQCGIEGSTYDHQSQREYLYVPLWGIAVFLLYAMRRIDCKICNSIKVESVPWSNGKSPITVSMMWYLSELAKLMSWSTVGKVTKTTWHQIYTSVT